MGWIPLDYAGRMGDMAEDGRVRLGKKMAEQRKRLGLSVRTVSEQAKINRDTWADAEAGKRTLQDHNHAKVEKALRWAEGSIAEILEGHEPVATTTDAPIDPVNELKLADEIEAVERMAHLTRETRLRIIQSMVRVYNETAAQGQAAGDSAS